jgi:putative heme-binding domain-containing protein
MNTRFLFPLSLLVAPALVHAVEPFQIAAGERILIMGDSLLEREGSVAALESRLVNHALDVPFTVRNLSFSADLPTGVSRASFDPATAGMERVREQLALVKPTVAVLGFGMAASLEEMTHASRDPNLNADPTRYGSVFSAAKFKADLAALMNAITASNEGKPVRFVLLAPLKHEDLRAKRPALPDPAAHNALLFGYTQAIRELAAERGARFVDPAAVLQTGSAEPLTDNGIHPSVSGLERWADGVASELGWAKKGPGLSSAQSQALRQALQRKNELFFHRWRPANFTYILGFRKREQGRNAAEIEQFDGFLVRAEEAITALKAGKPAPEEKVLPADAVDPTPIARPEFQLGDGLEISLWAENPLLSKPVAMNWDARGRLWVASTPIYPQIQPGAYPTDRVFILEDTKHSGHADKVTLFAQDLLIPTGLEPELGPGAAQSAYVGASTELLQLTDTDGDGKADQRRVVLSGFGTEDTHHTIHSLHWGVDGRLYFSQSIYIHSHMETPWGVVRLNSGGVLAYDPRSEKVEVFSKGLVNTWGHHTNAEGQTFLTDGAGSTGLSWAYPGATFAPFEGSTSTMPSASSGSYPKFSGLALIRSPLFPADWQGNAITCDFRAHRMVRFSINDLEKATPARSGFATSDQPDVIRTPDASFRPIDVKFGPDGALYVADWTNPMINHGEVDFRDPRRDKTHGRIWRIVAKDAKALPWQALTDRSTVQLLDGLLSPNLWEQEQSRRVLSQRLRKDGMADVTAWQKRVGSPEAAREAGFVRSAALGATAALQDLETKDAAGRAWEARWLGATAPAGGALERLVVLSQDTSARVRLEAMRALARIPELGAVEAVLKAAVAAPQGDAPYAFGAGRSIRELSGVWLEAIRGGRWAWKGHEAELLTGLKALDASVAGPVLASIMADLELPADGSGPWAELLAHAGGPTEAGRIWALVRRENQAPGVIVAGLQALKAAAVRGVSPAEGIASVADLIKHKDAEIAKIALGLAGAWKRVELAPQLGALAAGGDAGLRDAAVEGLGQMGGEAALKEARMLLAPERPLELRRKALGILVKVRPADASAAVGELLAGSTKPGEAVAVWRVLISSSNLGLAEKVAKELGVKLSPESVKAGLDAAQEQGGRGKNLVSVFKGLTQGGAVSGGVGGERPLEEWTKLVQERGNALKGERIYHSGMMSCVQCHAIGGAGGKLGPDMSTLGASAPLDYVIESVLNPAAKVKEGYHGVSYTLTDGGAMVGIPVEESGTSIRVRVPGGMEMEVAKAKIKSSEILGSLMPAGLVEMLSEEDKLNLFAFLGSVGRPGAFDASSGAVARSWRIVASLDSVKGEALALAPLAFSLTDGRLLPEHLQMPLAVVTGSETVFGVTKLAVGNAGKVRVEVEGASEVWLDGEKAVGQIVERELGAGTHTLSVGFKRGALPAVLKATASHGRFVAP